MPDHLRAEIREEVRAQIKEMVTHVMQNTDDVGHGFAEEARKIHYNEAPARAIRGVASRQEAEELVEEGIPVASLPFAVFDKSELN